MPDNPVRNDTDIEIANAALAMIGSPAIQSFEDETALARKVNAVFVDLVESCIEAHGWSFAITTVELQRLATTPLNGYAYAFAMPPARIGQNLVIRETLRSRVPLRDYKVAGGNVFADATRLWATYRTRPEVAFWSPIFRRFVTTALAAELCVPVSHDSDLAEKLESKAWGAASENRRGGLFQKAMAADLSGSPGFEPLYDADPLTDARQSSATNWFGD
jgi:hypothetical protein